MSGTGVTAGPLGRSSLAEVVVFASGLMVYCYPQTARLELLVRRLFLFRNAKSSWKDSGSRSSYRIGVLFA